MSTTERTETFDAAAADVWSALRAAPEYVKGLALVTTDDAARSVRFKAAVTFWTLTTLGQEISGTVVARGDTCELRLSGHPKIWSLTAAPRIRSLHEQIVTSIRTRLARQAMS